jgi:type I restriction enzyme S subunit
MIADLKPYSAMKDSCVEWLGEVPQHWEVRRGKWIFRHRKQINADGAEANVLSLTLRGVVNNDPDNPEGLVPKDYATYQLFRKGDLVFKLIDLENLRTSRVGLVHEDGIMSSAYVRLVSQVDLEIRYFYQQYFDLYQRGVYNQLGAGVRSTLGPSDLLELSILVPSMDEQAAIVRYLDHVDRRVRRLTRAKRKLIALLTEQKQAIIHRAVTRGLDPDVPLQDSGVEWLGEVPEHWEVRRSKQTFTQRKELARPDDIQLSATQAYGVIAQDEYERRVGRKIVKVFLHLEKRRHVEVDDFVISMRSFQGGLERAWVSGCIRSSYVVLRPITEVDVGFFSYLFKSRGYIGALQSTADFIRDGQDLNFANFCGVDLPVPPLEEQRRIADALREALEDANRVMERAEREINLLAEYRTRLIADVVTGKLDVRDAAAALPDVDPLTEPDDTDDLDADLDMAAGEPDEALEEVEA